MKSVHLSSHAERIREVAPLCRRQTAHGCCVYIIKTALLNIGSPRGTPRVGIGGVQCSHLGRTDRVVQGQVSLDDL